MEMVIGGAFQGKSLYAEDKYPQIAWVRGETLNEEALLPGGGGSGIS